MRTRILGDVLLTKAILSFFAGYSVPNQTCILLNCAIDIKHLVLRCRPVQQSNLAFAHTKMLS